MKADHAAREALVPLAAGATLGTLARIAADGEPAPAHAALLDPALAPLLECGLYQAGQQAKAAARLLRLPGKRWLHHSREALHVVNPGDVVGLGTENGRSAELGLALALLMFRAQTDARAVLASGALALNSGRHEIGVLPVHQLTSKLEVVLRHFSQPGSAPAPRWFLVPIQDPDGTLVQERYAAQARALHELGVELRGVADLHDAASLLGVRRHAVSAGARRIRASLAAAAGISAMIAAAGLWWRSPIELDFLPATSSDGAIRMTPARAAKSANGTVLPPPCPIGSDGLPLVVIGDQLAVHLRTGVAGDLATRVGGYQHVLVAVSGSSGVKVLAPPTSAPIVPGSESDYLLEVRAPEEETLLVWLAKRGAPFDNEALEREVRAAIGPLRPGERISSVRNLLSRVAPGVLSYSFRSVALGACP